MIPISADITIPVNTGTGRYAIKSVPNNKSKMIEAPETSEDFLNLEVNNGEFYLSALIDKIKAFYTDKLSLLKIDFAVDAFSDHILSGDLERSIEVLQNIIENAVKYGDGKRIRIAFSREDDCQLIHIRNSGCTLSKNELPHIFDSFWRVP